MTKVVSIQFEGNNKKYFFEPITNLNLNDFVVVETARGLEIGMVAEETKEVDESSIFGELKKVIRKATPKDIMDYEENKKIKPELYKECKKIVSESGLDMKVLDVSYTLDRSKLLLNFTSDGRVDFRELVKTMAAKYHTRIELRQVGPRDASRIISGLGECGREVCCSAFLTEIQNVTVKMAKNQKLSLNPTAISGLCGKLLCCIAYEAQDYEQLDEEVKNKMKDCPKKDNSKNDSSDEEEVITVEV